MTPGSTLKGRDGHKDLERYVEIRKAFLDRKNSAAIQTNPTPRASSRVLYQIRVRHISVLGTYKTLWRRTLKYGSEPHDCHTNKCCHEGNARMIQICQPDQDSRSKKASWQVPATKPDHVKRLMFNLRLGGEGGVNTCYWRGQEI